MGTHLRPRDSTAPYPPQHPLPSISHHSSPSSKGFPGPSLPLSSVSTKHSTVRHTQTHLRGDDSSFLPKGLAPSIPRKAAWPFPPAPCFGGSGVATRLYLLTSRGEHTTAAICFDPQPDDMFWLSPCRCRCLSKPTTCFFSKYEVIRSYAL